MYHYIDFTAIGEDFGGFEADTDKVAGVVDPVGVDNRKRGIRRPGNTLVVAGMHTHPGVVAWGIPDKA